MGIYLTDKFETEDALPTHIWLEKVLELDCLQAKAKIKKQMRNIFQNFYMTFIISKDIVRCSRHNGIEDGSTVGYLR